MEESIEIENWSRISILGSGGFGIVSLWKQKKSYEYIAIKKCKFQLSSALTEKQKKRWENEVTIMKSLKHPNIVESKALPFELEKHLSKYNPTNLPLLSMEYCKLGNLRHILNQVGNCTGLPENHIRLILKDIATGLIYLHGLNITHRDIKPENIVLQECHSRPEKTIYKIIDLGYAKELNDATVSFVGTLHYLAPEIVKTQSYNFSVDYWSLGIVTFEICCGVLPFLPQFTPFQRFQFIEKKKFEHICIYQSQHNEKFVYSSELMRENYISSCFQENIQVFLRHVLNLDPVGRAEKISHNQISVLDYLLTSLNKKSVTVFSVYTLEFYWYEINDGILIDTLKNWISRDTKVNPNDQILLDNENNCCDFTENNDEYVVNVFNCDSILFVFKKGAFLNRDTFTLPKNIQWLFENITKTLKWREIRSVYSKSLFYLTQEKKMINSLLQGFKLYLGYLDCLNRKLKVRFFKVQKKTTELLFTVNCYNKLRFNSVDFENTPVIRELSKLLLRFEEILSGLHRNIGEINKIGGESDILIKRKGLLDKFLVKITPILDHCDFSVQISGVTALLAKGSNDNNSSHELISCRDITKIVSDAIKKKDKLLNNKTFQNYYKALSVAIKDVSNILSRINTLSALIDKLFSDLEDNQKQQQFILVSCLKKSKITNNICNCDSDLLIEENRELRCEFEETLSKLFVEHKEICDQLKSIQL